MRSIPIKCLISLVLISLWGMSLPGCLSRDLKVVRGQLEGDLTWQGTVFISGDVTLPEDSKLTLLPGTRIRFLEPDGQITDLIDHPNFKGSELIVSGQLIAIGTPEKPIIFESAHDSSTSALWGAINIVNSSESVFEYCIFRNADSAIHSRNSNVYIQESVFENNLVGVRFHNSEILVENSLLRHNGSAIRFHFGSPVICENQFVHNDVNLFVTAEPKDYRIENNTFGMASKYQVVLGESVPDDFIVPRNYWPELEKSGLIESFYDGRRSDYLGKVLFEPTLTMPSRQAGISWTP